MNYCTRDSMQWAGYATGLGLIAGLATLALLSTGCLASGGDEIAKIAANARLTWTTTVDADGVTTEKLDMNMDAASDWNIKCEQRDDGTWILQGESDGANAITGTQSIALSNNATLQAGFGALQALAGRYFPGVTGSAPVKGTGEPASDAGPVSATAGAGDPAVEGPDDG